MEQPDEHWVEKALQDPDAFSELVKRYQGRIYSLVLWMVGSGEEAEDLAQEVFVRAFVGLHGFRRGARFSPWLHRIAVNLCLNHLRRRKSRAETPEEANLADPSPSPERLLELKESRLALEEALRELAPEFQAVILLRHINGLSYEEIAQVLGTPLGTVKTHLHRARRALQSRLKQTVLE